MWAIFTLNTFIVTVASAGSATGAGGSALPAAVTHNGRRACCTEGQHKGSGRCRSPASTGTLQVSIDALQHCIAMLLM
jgi:hypothetical protein